jgi:uncharacterized protein
MGRTTTFATLGKSKYVRLTTFRKDGSPVSTPVWVAPDAEQPHVLYVFTGASSGKLKRIRNNGSVRLAPCTMRGRLKGDAIEAVATVLPPDRVESADRALTRKYPIVKRLVDYRQRNSKGKRAYLQFTPA